MSKNNEEMAKAFNLRDLTADDIFPMCQIISKIGVKEFKHCFESPDLKSVIANATSGEDKAVDVTAVGMSVAFDIAGIILSNIASCKNDIYSLLANLSGMTPKEISKLPMLTFTEMVIAVVKKDEFKDFFQGVAKLLK